jgi:hypothetical protein
MHELARCLVLGPGGSTYAGFVESFEQDVLAVKMQDFVTDLDQGVAVEMRVLDEVRGEVHYQAVVREIISGLVEFTRLKQLSIRQRRGAARVRVAVRTTAILASEQQEPREIPITVLDVSASGVKILSPEQLHVGQGISFDFPTNDTVLSLTANVVWSEESATGWRHGCRLDRPGPRDVELLFRFVLLTQGAQRREAMDRAVAAR